MKHEDEFITQNKVNNRLENISFFNNDYKGKVKCVKQKKEISRNVVSVSYEAMNCSSVR